MKEYKSNDELLNYLLLKGVIVNNKKKAKEQFEKYTYYSIVNTYKEVFKTNNQYISGVTFEEIFSLYDFDKNLRSIFLKYALEIEIIIKSLVANIVAENYGIKDYLDINCFDANNNAKEKQIKELQVRINDEIEKNYGKHPAITHYKNTYGYIPPFVLVKVLTLGEISRYYIWLKQNVRQQISKYFKLSDKVLEQILFNLTLARNICAHNDKLYTFRSRFFISFNYIDSSYVMKDKSTNFYMLMKCMSTLLDNKKYSQFEKEIFREMHKLSKKLKSINIKQIKEIMGFPNE